MTAGRCNVIAIEADRLVDVRHEELGRRIVGQYVVSHEPGAVFDEVATHPARAAQAAVDALLAEIARDEPALGEQVHILSQEPGSAPAFRAGVRLLAAWLDLHPARVPAVAQLADDTEGCSLVTYHLGELVGAGPQPVGVSADWLDRLPAPGLNPAKDRAELAVIVPVGFPEGQPERLRNCLAVLHALNRQHLDRSRYRVVVVEQGPRPRAGLAVAGLADDYVFAPNPGDFNKSWAFNIAVNLVDSVTFLCLLDADALPDPQFLDDCLRHLRAGESALLPFTDVLFLDKACTAVALHQVLPLDPGSSSGSVDYRWLRGFTMPNNNVGISVWVSRERYLAVGGHDERYRGWSYEDIEFHGRLVASGGVRRLPGMLPHLWHPRPRMTFDGGMTRPNYYLRQLPRPADGSQADGSRPGDPDRYLCEFERSQSGGHDARPPAW
jgi:hypothetical protein